MEMDRILLIVGRDENSLSVISDTRPPAIIVDSRQRVAYTCIRMWGIP
jgi:hypothetical protein